MHCFFPHSILPENQSVALTSSESKCLFLNGIDPDYTAFENTKLWIQDSNDIPIS